MSTSEQPANEQAEIHQETGYDAVLIVSFGGPEGPDEVLPFLENVLRGKNVPHERMLEVAEHYQHFGGVSPINEQNRQLIAALEAELAEHGPHLRVYWGNRNWNPLLADTLRKMRDDGVQRAIAFFTSSFSSYSGCRQYREDIMRAQEEVGEGTPQVDKLRVFFNHPGFIEPLVESVKEHRKQISPEARDDSLLMFTAHSIPLSMAQNCRYEAQLQEACRLVAEQSGHSRWELVYQSRSGPPQQPWLEPDVCDRITALHEADKLSDLMILPIGFISDHMEVLFDLDTEAAELCEELGVCMQRLPTVGTHPRFIRMIRELIEERVNEDPQRQALGDLGPSHDVCPVDCCLYTPKPPLPANAS
ncbi:ferrochelatase [Adhaeretor mobilis]|uniref:Ferrochelatase n=1 Tax=Adhaeretor mobilis TaxID=1930276 RepID=A0A517MV13_9BACT|nr:ferrochelatase [Adhaeretor mobilis]QDS98723.1 Ferrochelatase [Adhaeretor mobilis]